MELIMIKKQEVLDTKILCWNIWKSLDNRFFLAYNNCPAILTKGCNLVKSLETLDYVEAIKLYQEYLKTVTI